MKPCTSMVFSGDPLRGWNPYSSDTNNAMAIADGSNNYSAQLTMFEAPYMFNMLDGKQYLCWLMAIMYGTRT